jgi:hypothetical protein
LLGRLLQTGILGYFAELDFFQALFGALMKVVHFKPTSAAGIISADLQVEFLFGVPTGVRANGRMTLDVGRNITAAFSVTNDPRVPSAFQRASGFMASTLEAATLKALLGELSAGALSTTTAFQAANNAGLPVYRITQSNLARILPQLQISAPVEEDIQSGVNTGKVITIPKQEVTIGAVQGIGYLVEDPATGAGAYLISGGLAGGNSLCEFGQSATDLCAAISGTLLSIGLDGLAPRVGDPLLLKKSLLQRSISFVGFPLLFITLLVDLFILHEDPGKTLFEFVLGLSMDLAISALAFGIIGTLILSLAMVFIIFVYEEALLVEAMSPFLDPQMRARVLTLLHEINPFVGAAIALLPPSGLSRPTRFLWSFPRGCHLPEVSCEGRQA